MSILCAGGVAFAEPVPASELKDLLQEISTAHEGATLALASYRISYTYKGEAMDDAKIFHQAMRNRSLYLRGQTPGPKGEPIKVADWLPREFACELMGTTSQHRLSYRCLRANIYDRMPEGSVSVEVRQENEYLHYLMGREKGVSLPDTQRLAPNYLDLLNLLPVRLPYLEKPGVWGTRHDDTIADLLGKALADPAKYEVTAFRENGRTTCKVLQTFGDNASPGAGIMWTLHLDPNKNYSPLSVTIRPGKRIDTAFQEYGYGDQITCSGYVEASPGIWMPTEIVAEHQGRLRAFIKADEDTRWNSTNVSLEATMRIARHSVKVDKIELNEPVSDEELAPRIDQGRQ